MQTTGIAELKASLSEFLARVRAGEEVLVTDRGRPIARIVPMAAPSPEAMDDMIRAGIVRPPRRPADPALWRGPLPEDPKGAVRRELLAERDESR